MRKVLHKVEQSGTLLVEALAMLGLIAMVTPTLYKKSAERLQEIQDINAASQARTMNNVVETFIKTHFQQILLETSSASDPKTVKIAYDDNTNGYFEKGYSSFLPYGYSPDTIKNYKAPEIYVHRDGTSLVSYIVFPHLVDPGKKRAARLASLVGANGGLVTYLGGADGTGGAWSLSSSMIHDLEIDLSDVGPNSLVITANEPIQNSTEDNDKFLYRVDAEEDSYHNSMITDLFMGGIPDQITAYSSVTSPDNFYGIYNVRKLTLNTRCDKIHVGSSAVAVSNLCDPSVADLYIGKPLVGANYDEDGLRPFGNNAAAWIYGNLNAINEGFKVTSDSSRTAEFVFGPSGDDTASSGANYELIYAKGNYDSSDVEVRFLGEFVSAKKDAAGGYTFSVGSSMIADDDNDAIQAYSNLGDQKVRLGMMKDADVYIAEKGGNVYINAADDSSSTMVHAHTKINSGGGTLEAGIDAGWLLATGRDNSTTVQMLKNKEGLFVVGEAGANDDGNLMFADYGGSSGTSSSQVSLYGQRFIVKKDTPYDIATGMGGANGSGYDAKEGLTVVASEYTDIFGSTYMGTGDMSSEVDDGALYSRGEWTLGVAGSAWVDETLWARRAWLKSAGMKNLHAGFSSYEHFEQAEKTGWLNVYGGGELGGSGGVVVRNRDKIVTPDSYGDNTDIMFLASSSYAYMSDTDGAFVLLNEGRTKVGSESNFFASDKSSSSDASGSSYVVGANGIKLYTTSTTINSSAVDIQDGAMMFYGHAGSSGTYENKILGKAGEFGLITGSTAVSDIDDAQLYANGDLIRTRYVDFEVQRDMDASSVVFGVYPNAADLGSANVEVNGSIHVKGNDVIHIASDMENTAENDSSRAMFEIDPNYIRVWAKKSSGEYADGGDDYYAMLTINPTDVGGSSLATTVMDDTSIYVRRGAIELMESQMSGSSAVYAADEGYGYIKANRFVSNVADKIVPEIATQTGGTDRGVAYDQYMVNPAYTSVMHDIKLTTRGGARLSDILPDFVLKGVYNVSNDYIENTDLRIKWSAGSDCDNGSNCASDGVTVAWASPYLGLVPYAMCPPGYKNMATIVPISFQLGRVGRVVESGDLGGYGTRAKWMLSEPTRQADILDRASSSGISGLHYPGLEAVSSLVWNDIYNSSQTFSQFVSDVQWKTEGWYWGLKATNNQHGSTTADFKYSGEVGLYDDGAGKTLAVAEPLYFQEGTFLKTSLNPIDEGWEGRMGFIYNTDHWGGNLTAGLSNDGIRSNNTDVENGIEGADLSGDYVWNLFPVPTNTLEGHATVYCYFDRSQFNAYPDMVLQFNSKSDDYDHTSKTNTDQGGYVERLNDPSLKYGDPW